jgi:hypothetical protein
MTAVASRVVFNGIRTRALGMVRCTAGETGTTIYLPLAMGAACL